MLKQKQWYENIEPNLQITILKVIAKNGFQSKSSLLDHIDSKPSTIETIVNKMEDAKHGLIQRCKKEQVTRGKKPQILFSLTEKGIHILIKSHYQKTTEPYLNRKEFQQFIKRYEHDYEILSNDNLFAEWKRPKIIHQNVTREYLEANQEIYAKYKPIGKIKKLLKKAQYVDSEINNALYQFIASQSNSKKKKK